MAEAVKFIYQGGAGEIVEKKSRFISAAGPADSEEEAEEFILSIRKKYPDATHHCFAYVIGRQNQIQRCSDDGEPAKTAGKPILDVLTGEKIHNAVIVVTRYFGGTLLGTGGLVRAYSKAAKEGIKQSIICEKFSAFQYLIVTDYNGFGKIKKASENYELPVLNIEYSQEVGMTLLLTEEKKDKFIREITDLTGGKVKAVEEAKVFYTIVNDKVLVFQE